MIKRRIQPDTNRIGLLIKENGGAQDVTFRGPLGTADDAESCLKGRRGMGEMISDIVVRQIFTAGEKDVITWFDLYPAEAGPVPTANWSHLEDGKIAEIRATFEPRPLLT